MNRDSSPTEGDLRKIKIEDIGDEDDPLGRINGKVVIINEIDADYIDVGEKLWIKINSVKPDVAFAEPSPIEIPAPFFSYGIFRRGQIAHRRISDYIDPQREVTGHSISGRLLYEDGIIMLENGTIGDRSRRIDGDLIYFRSERAEEAYQNIEAAEPMSHYAWDQVDVDGTTANVLIKNPKYSIENPDEMTLRGDPEETIQKYFQKSMKTVKEDAPIIDNTDHPDLTFFRLQRGYMLMWSAIERYVSLRWAQEDDDWKKDERERFAENDVFLHDAINRLFNSAPSDVYRTIYRSDDPSRTIRLEPEDPVETINYFYQIRSNVTHRGKGDPGADKALLERAFVDLYNIFVYILHEQYEELSLNRLSNGEISI